MASPSTRPPPDDPVDALRIGIDAWLEATEEPEVHRIVLIEVPAALGWERWREIGTRYGGGLVEAALVALVEAGRLAPQPVPALTHVLLGAIEEGALYAARSSDRAAATAEVRAALFAVLDGLLLPPPR